MATVNLQKSYSKLNEALGKLFDESGVRRSFTVPYIEGQSMSDHVNAVNQAAQQSGGMTKNMALSMHHSDGKGWGSGDGHTIGHSADKLRTTIIPKGDKNAVAVIEAAQAHLNNLKKLLGDDNPATLAAQSQLDLVKKTDAVGMNLLDLGVLITQMMYRPTQTAARMHSGTKPGGHSPQLRGPVQEEPEEQEQPEGEQAAAPAEGEQPQGQ